MSAPIEGVWEMIRAETDGENSPDLLTLRVELEIRPGAYVVRFAGEIADRGTFAVEPNGGLTLVGTEGPNRDRTIPCLYQLVNNRLRICYGLDGAAPTTFATAAGQPRYLATYRRKS